MAISNSYVSLPGGNLIFRHTRTHAHTHTPKTYCGQVRCSNLKSPSGSPIPKPTMDLDKQHPSLMVVQPIPRTCDSSQPINPLVRLNDGRPFKSTDQIYQVMAIGCNLYAFMRSKNHWHVGNYCHVSFWYVTIPMDPAVPSDKVFVGWFSVLTTFSGGVWIHAGYTHVYI